MTAGGAATDVCPPARCLASGFHPAAASAAGASQPVTLPDRPPTTCLCAPRSTNIHWTKEHAQGEATMIGAAYRLARMDFHWSSIEKTEVLRMMSASQQQQHAVQYTTARLCA